MNRLYIAITLAAGIACVTFAGPVVAQQQNSPRRAAGALSATKSYQGTVTALNSNGFTITTRRGNQSVTVTTTDQTRYTVVERQPVTSLQVGEAVLVAGAVNSDAATVEARNIMPVKALPKHAPAQSGAEARGIAGTIAGISPQITLTGIDGKTYTVETSARTSVVSHEPAAAGDVAVGKTVQVRYVPAAAAGADESAVTAQMVVINNTPRPRAAK